MNDPAIIAAAVVVVLTSLGGTMVLVINAWSASKDRREAAKERLEQLTLAKAAAAATVIANAKTDTLIEGTAKIHELTNSTNSQLQKALDLMTARHAAALDIVAHLEAEKRETAATRVITDLQRDTALATTATPRATTAGADQLEKIEQNTAATVDVLKDQAKE